MLAVTASPALPLDPDRATSQYGFTEWDTRSGLPSDSVHALRQTRDHYLWLGTSAGLVRFDGARFLVYNGRHAAALGEGRVSVLEEGPGDTLFVGTSQGATLRYLAGAFTPIGFPFRTSETTGVRSLLLARDGTLWVGVLSWRLCRYTGGDRATAVPAAELDLFGAQAIAQGPGGVWIGSLGQGLFLHEGGGYTRHAVTNDRIQALLVDRAGAVWMGTPHGLGRYAGGRTTWYTAADGLSHPNVTALLEDRDGNLWAGTAGGGLTRLTGGVFRRLTTREGLSDDDVRCLTEDHEGNVWVGTSKGLTRIGDGPFVTYGPLEGVSEMGVQSIAEGGDGSVWIGSSAASVVRLHKEGVTRFALKPSPGLDGAIAVHPDGKGGVWVSQDTGRLFRIAKGVVTEHPLEGALGTWKVSAMSEDEQGMLFFVTGVGLARLAGSRVVALHPGAPDVKYVSQIYRGRDGTLWLSSSRGLVRVRGNDYKVFAFAGGYFASRVRGVIEDEDGSLWMATASGLAHYKDETITPVTTAHGLPENYLRLVLDDGRGYLWIASRSQLFRVSKAEALDVVKGRRASIAPLSFDASDGLATTESLLGSNPGFRGRDGRLWFATAKGVSVVDPARFEIDIPAPAVRIEGVTVDGERVRREEYDPGRGEVTIEYAALAYRSSRKIRFRYRLDGLDRDWVDAGSRRSAYYSNLPPGRYSFSVAASSATGLWNGAPARLELRIRPPFRQTPLFYAACAGAVLLLAAALHRLRLAQMHARLGAVIAERTRIARELHDSLAQSLAGTKLQIDVALGTLPEESPTRRHLQLARSMIGAGLQEVRRSIWVLRAQAARGPEGLGAALSESLARLTSESAARLTLDIAGDPRPLAPDIERNLLRIAHEAVTNAVRHARAENISATLHFVDDGVHLRVCDDGVGFDAESMRRQGDHFGLMGMAERARALGGELHVESAAEAGTAIECRLPYRPRGFSDVLPGEKEPDL